MSIDVKTSGLAEFESALRKYEVATSKTREKVLEHRARNLAFALYKEALKVGVQTMNRIRKTPATAMKARSGGRTQKQEKARRIFAAGFVASGWLPSIKAFKSGGSVRALAKVPSPSGAVVVNYRDNYIELINSTNGAQEAENKHQISDNALRNQAEDMRRYLQKKAEEDLEKSWS